MLGALRGFALIPVTNLVVLAIPLFPPVPLLVLTLVGIAISSASIYAFAGSLKLGEYFERKHARHMERVQTALRRNPTSIVTAWSFLPIVPTDLICYVCGVMRISFRRFMFGVLVGEGAICAVYIFAGASLLDLGKRVFGADVAEAQVAAQPAGAAVYAEHCALCHEQVDERIPHRSALQQMPAARIVRALDAGAMLAIAMSMNRDERLAVAEYLGTDARRHGAAGRGVLHRPHGDARGRRRARAGTAGARRPTTRAINRPSARACAPSKCRTSRSNGRSASPATSRRSRRRRSSTATSSSAAPAGSCTRSPPTAAA